jgi:hypothetical protein
MQSGIRHPFIHPFPAISASENFKTAARLSGLCMYADTAGPLWAANAVRRWKPLAFSGQVYN